MNSKIKWFGLLMVLMLAAAFAQKTFTSHEGGFTITPPKGWKSENGSQYGVLAVFYGPIEKNFAVNINYVVENLPTSMSLGDYTTAALRAVAGSMDNYKVISKRTVSVAGTKATEHIYEFNLNEAGMKLKGKQLIFVRGRKAQVFTFTALTSNYSKHVSTFDQSMKTLRWK
jgi:hypothetical protein